MFNLHIKESFQRIMGWFKKLSFKTGLIILTLCIPFYVLSFVQMGWNISYAAKGALWVAFFGAAKTCQYLGLAILGVDGIKRLKAWWSAIRIQRYK